MSDVGMASAYNGASRLIQRRMMSYRKLAAAQCFLFAPQRSNLLLVFFRAASISSASRLLLLAHAPSSHGYEGKRASHSDDAGWLALAADRWHHALRKSVVLTEDLKPLSGFPLSVLWPSNWHLFKSWAIRKE
jgi:hypothetical protein